MASFHANPNDEYEPWLERAAIDGYGFRIWHLMFFIVAGCLSIIVFLAFCIKMRIPRTKQDIEADYLRKKLARKFKQRLRLIENQYMDNLDLKKALEIIQQDYKNDQEYIKNLYDNSTSPIPKEDKKTTKPE